MNALDAAAHPTALDVRIEEAGLNALQMSRQLFYDGWLLRLSPGKAKRGRSVNPHFASSLPVGAKIAHCERLYGAHDLPALFRITPFQQPQDLAACLAARGYLAFDRTLVQVRNLVHVPVHVHAEVDLVAAPVADFVAAVGALRGSSSREQAAHLERLRESALATQRICALRDAVVVGVAQAALDGDVVGLFDVHTATHARGQGIASAMAARLLAWGWDHGATRAYLQVESGNAAALRVYERLGFATAYEYHYLGRPGECR